MGVSQGKEKVLQVVLVGQEPELGEKIALPRLLGLRQDLVVRSRLEHLKREEVTAFIQHRLRLVGCEREDLFSPESLRLITLYSHGIPRLINLLCDNALREAYRTSQQGVSETILQKVAHNLLLTKEEASPPDKLQKEGSRRASRKTAPASMVGAVSIRRRERFLSVLAWGGGGMVVLILLGIVFSTFSTTREGKEQAKSSFHALRTVSNSRG